MTDDSFPCAPLSDWPEAWLMPDEVANQKLPNRLEPNVAVSAEELNALGILCWTLDADHYQYPIRAVPWDPNDAVDPKLQALRDARGYSYADIITIHPDHLPEYDLKVKAFFEEHIHDAEEIRYILAGSGYFDVRDKEDRWVGLTNCTDHLLSLLCFLGRGKRIHVQKGHLMTLPEGIYHRFTCDDKDYIHAMRLFIGQPIWTPFNRPQEDHPSRTKYVEHILAEEKKEEDGSNDPASKRPKTSVIES